MRRTLSGLLALLVLTLLVPVSLPAAAGPTTVDTIKKRGALLAGVETSSPPFSFLDPSKKEIVGVDVDLAREIAKKLDVPLKLVPVNAKDRIPRLIDGEIDFIAGPMTKNPDRALLVDFSRTYFVTSQLVITKKGAVKEAKELLPLRIGVVRGTSSERNIRALAPAGSIHTYAGINEGGEALRKGEIDALTGDGVRLYGILYRLPEGKFEINRNLRLAVDSYGMAVRKGDVALLGVLNATLDELDRSGREKEICESWFLCRPDPPGGAAEKTAPAGAYAVITRNTETIGRYLAISMGGLFRDGGEVSIHDAAGNPVGKGVVHSIYGDEIYLDTASKDLGTGTGMVVSMNQSEAQVAEFVHKRAEAIKKIREASIEEADQIRREIASEHKAEVARRERFQEEMEKEKMELDYKYGDYYYYYYYPWWP